MKYRSLYNLRNCRDKFILALCARAGLNNLARVRVVGVSIKIDAHEGVVLFRAAAYVQEERELYSDLHLDVAHLRACFVERSKQFITTERSSSESEIMPHHASSAWSNRGKRCF